MPARRVRVAATAHLEAGLDALRAEAGVPAAFPADVEAEAAAAAAREPEGERVDIPFVTIDPPGSRDLDQAVHIERRGDGHRVHYAIADVGAWVRPGEAIDREAHARGVTVYAPDHRTPLHPPVLSEGGASLLPDQWCPAVLWTLDLDGSGEHVGTEVVRAVVRSRAQHTYEDVPPELAPLLQEVGERRAALQRARGGVQLDVPEQEVVEEGGGWTTRFREIVPSEDWNAQVSLLTGMAAAQLMLRAGTGILRTQPDPDPKALAQLRLQAGALGAPWPEDQPYAAFIASLDPAVGAHAALLREATGVGRGAGYTAFDGAPPAGAHALRAGGGVRPRDRAAAAPAGPLRQRVLPGRARRHAGARLGACRAPGAPRDDGRRHPARQRGRARGPRPRRGAAAARARGRALRGPRRRRRPGPARRARRPREGPRHARARHAGHRPPERADPATRTVAFAVA
jgi:hypothetical protein